MAQTAWVPHVTRVWRSLQQARWVLCLRSSPTLTVQDSTRQRIQPCFQACSHTGSYMHSKFLSKIYLENPLTFVSRSQYHLFWFCVNSKCQIFFWFGVHSYLSFFSQHLVKALAYNTSQKEKLPSFQQIIFSPFPLTDSSSMSAELSAQLRDCSLPEDNYSDLFCGCCC